MVTMTSGWSRGDAHDVITEIDQLHHLARADGVSFAFPVRLYGIAGLVSAAALAWTPLWLYTSWWILVAIAAPPSIAVHYARWLRTRGIGLDWRNATRHVAAAELLAVLLWVQPFHPTSLSLPWLAAALGAVVAGRTWNDNTLQVLAAGVVAVVVTAALLTTPMALTDAVVGAWLCVISPWWRWRTTQTRERQLLPR
ncbi:MULTISPECIES: hypothetical protein [Saccharothrix]|uniref:hypothetical protein n=1 Tax=Saccharothrix TaxID=2071 RepID=UPI00093E39FA|nr:hypothetical protein [Saccharothrix sp. CB00851]OKI28615.1 hypothetical protein A6A25_30865 [Saccharothrix sp. CB00851]